MKGHHIPAAIPYLIYQKTSSNLHLFWLTHPTRLLGALAKRDSFLLFPLLILHPFYTKIKTKIVAGNNLMSGHLQPNIYTILFSSSISGVSFREQLVLRLWMFFSNGSARISSILCPSLLKNSLEIVIFSGCKI